MYKIKPKKGNNIIINDLGITLRSDSKDWTYISKEDFDNSVNIKSFLNFIIVEDASKPENNKSKSSNKKDKTVKVKENIFVSEGRTYENPKDVYVKSQEDIVDPVIEKDNKVEEVKEDKTKKETKVDKVKVKPEEEKEVKADVKKEEEKDETKPATKATAKSKAPTKTTTKATTKKSDTKK